MIKKMSHGGGGVIKVPKKCHVLLELPLIIEKRERRKERFVLMPKT